MTEQEIGKEVQLLWTKHGYRLFRNNVGTGWVGKPVRANKPTPTVLNPGDILLRHARPLHAGLIKGSGDYIGWKSITITPEMVGARVAVFSSIEIKTETGRPTPEQQNWITAVTAAGGYARIARTPEESIK